ncbi:hypothetical protein Ddc_14930 [Ditylenchus destructor]|nr:hypothetical protein Ddc_14930 [Ditylenchus destructor]
MYWMGIFMAIYLYTPAVPVFFLTLDRCIALKFPIHYNGKFMRGKMAITAVVITIIWCIALIIGLLQELPLDTTTVKYCLIVDCVTIKYNRVVGKYMKLSVVILNVLCTAYFLYALRTFKLSVGERNVFSMKNRVVIVTAVSETILNVAPTLFTTIFTSIYNDSPSDILGNYGILMFTLDAMICAIFYVKIYMRNEPQSIIINQYLGVNIVGQHWRKHHRPSGSMTHHRPSGSMTTSNMNSR